MKKRYLTVLGLIVAFALALTGCMPVQIDDAYQASYTTYATFYPIFALSSLILQNVPEMTLHCLVQPQDGCLRSYTLSDFDLYLLVNADVIIAGGRGLESFADRLNYLGENGPAVATCLQAVTLENQTDTSVSQEEDASHLDGANPWAFLSAAASIDIAAAITANMLTIDPTYEDRYEENLQRAEERLQALHDAIVQEVSACDLRQPVALLQEGLIYPAQEMELNIVTRIDRESGVNTDYQEYDTMRDTLQSAGAQVVLLEQQAPQMLLDKLVADGFRVALLDTLSTGREDDGSEKYFSALLKNAAAVRAALDAAEAGVYA